MPTSHPTRRTVVRAAAWTVPAVTLVSAAPAFAASTNSTNLSTTFVSAAPFRVAATPNKVEVPPTTFTNTGDLPAQGIHVAITASLPITLIEVMGMDVTTLGLPVTGLGTTDVTMTVPETFVTIEPGASAELPVSQVFSFASTDEVTMALTVTGINPAAAVNVPFTSGTIVIPA